MQPTIDWGTFEDKFGRAHIAPVIEGKLMDGHEVDMACNCGPKLEQYPKRIIFIHRVVH